MPVHRSLQPWILVNIIKGFASEILFHYLNKKEAAKQQTQSPVTLTKYRIFTFTYILLVRTFFIEGECR